MKHVKSYRNALVAFLVIFLVGIGGFMIGIVDSQAGLIFALGAIGMMGMLARSFSE